MLRKNLLLLCSLGGMLVVSGCGQTGPLYLPAPKVQSAQPQSKASNKKQQRTKKQDKSAFFI